MRPSAITLADASLDDLSGSVAEQVSRLRSTGESILRKHGKGIVKQGMTQKRYADALADVFAQIAVLSRVTSIFEEQSVEASGQERFIAETFCTRAARRVHSELDHIERNDDERMHAIARLAYKRGQYGYALFED